MKRSSQRTATVADHAALGQVGAAHRLHDIYRYDRITGQTTWVSRDAEGRGTVIEGSRDPAISANGRFVAFSSAAGDLVLHDTSFGFTERGGFAESGFPEDVFVKDLRSGAIIRASVDENGLQSEGTSFSPSLSGDAPVIAFVTDDPNILLGDTPGDSVVVTEADFSRLPVDDIPGAPPGAAGIRRNFQPDPSFDAFQQADSDIPLNFALRNTIDRPGDQDWFRVSLFAGKTYVIDLEGRPTRRGTLDDPLLRIFVPQNSGR